jgi:hypothetical protein
VFTALLEHQSSAIHVAVSNPLHRRLMMGVAMGLMRQAPPRQRRTLHIPLWLSGFDLFRRQTQN